MNEASDLIIQKFAGTKNSFFIVDQTDKKARQAFEKIFPGGRIEFVKAITQKRLGHEADGVLFLDPVKNAGSGEDLVWDFYNKDGSVAEMCGNAARCATLYWLKTKNKNEVSMKTLAGPVSGVIEGQYPTVTMSEVKELHSAVEFQANGLLKQGSLVNTGVPHFVILVDKIDFSDSNQKDFHRELAKSLRWDPRFGGSGANITFLENSGDDLRNTYTFERGVEDFTESCGTGAVAAAFVWMKTLGTSKKAFSLVVPGGRLNVNLESLLHPKLSGETQFLYEIVFQGGK